MGGEWSNFRWILGISFIKNQQNYKGNWNILGKTLDVLRKSDATFHSGGVRIFPAAQIEAQTCADAREAIADISDNFGCSKNQG